MNLKSKLQHKVTAVVSIIDDTSAIFSDECSPTHINALTIITAATKQDLWNAIKDRAREQASAAKFRCLIALIKGDTITYIRDEQPKPEYQDTNNYKL